MFSGAVHDQTGNCAEWKLRWDWEDATEGGDGPGLDPVGSSINEAANEENTIFRW